jgi:hypothetical protein
MTVLHREGFDMTMDPIGGAAEDVRGALIRAHQDDLLAQAAAERQVHQLRQGQCPEPSASIRRRLGLGLVRVGQALAGDAPRHAGQGHVVRPT